MKPVSNLRQSKIRDFQDSWFWLLYANMQRIKIFSYLPIGRTDDITLGYLVNYLLEVSLTEVEGFHNHNEDLKQLPSDYSSLQKMVSSGYRGKNVMNISGFDVKDDPTR